MGKITKEKGTTTTIPSKDQVKAFFETALQEVHADDLFLEFQLADRKQRGYVTFGVFEHLLGEVISTKKNMQLGPIASLFESKKDRIDYSKFCEALDIFSRTGRLTSSLRLKEENANQLIIHTDKKRTRLVRRESSRSLQRRASWHKSDENSAEQSESDFTMRTIRMDPRLETQRILRQSIRRKLQKGLMGGLSDGFSGIQETMMHEDQDGSGYLTKKLFMKQILKNLKDPLTKKESEYLLANVQHLHDVELVDYEQIGSFLNFGSDSCDTESNSDDMEVPSVPEAHLGANFLAGEREIRHFLESIIPSTSKNPCRGVEKFLEVAKQHDRTKSGFLHEKDFEHVLTFCGIKLSPALIRSLLSRFPRSDDGSISYVAFVDRYVQKQFDYRERENLKAHIKLRLKRYNVELTEYIQYLRDRFEKHDMKHHSQKIGLIIEKDFKSVLKGNTRNGVAFTERDLKKVMRYIQSIPSITLSKDKTIEINYNEFLSALGECQATQQKDSCEASDKINKSCCDPTKYPPTQPWDQLCVFLNSLVQGQNQQGQSNFKVVERHFQQLDKAKNQAISDYLSAADLFDCLSTVGLRYSANGRKILLQSLTQRGINTEFGVNYSLLLRLARQDPILKRVDSKPPQEEDIAEYLLSSSTKEERQRMEKFMDMLQKFQDTLKSKECLPVTNGIKMHLGPRLRLQVAFIVED